MSKLRLLYLDSHHLAAYRWQRGRLWREEVFSPTPTGWEQFAHYLSANPGGAFRMLANVGEEGHQIELIPFLRGKDRATLLERKFEQIFSGTLLVAEYSLGYEKTKRKNERLLLSALTNQALFQPWLNALAAAEAPLSGLYTISQFSGHLLSKLGKVPPRCLLVTMQDGSLRENYVVDGVTVFSRMVPLVDPGIAGMAAGVASEVGKLYQYLVGQRQVARNETLPVIVLALSSALSAVRAACVESAGLHYVVHDVADAAARIGLSQQPVESCCEEIFLKLLATAAPREQFLPVKSRHDFHVHKTKRWLLSGGFAALGGALLFTAWNLLAAYNNRQEALSFASDEAVVARRYQDVLATFPQLGVSNDALRQFAQRHQAIERVRQQPAFAYRYLSHAMDDSPAIELNSVEWRLGSSATQDGSSSKSVFLNATEVVTTVRGAIHLASSTPPRQIVSTFEQFVRRLADNPEVDVTVVQQPFDTEPGRTLKGNTDERSPIQAPTFALRIVWRLPA